MLQITLRDKDRRSQYTARTPCPSRKDTQVGDEEHMSPDPTRSFHAVYPVLRRFESQGRPLSRTACHLLRIPELSNPSLPKPELFVQAQGPKELGHTCRRRSEHEWWLLRALDTESP